MLLKDKNKPLFFSDSKFNHSLVNKLINIGHINSFSSIFLYGASGSGKYTLCKMLLAEIYGKEIYNTNTTNFEYQVNGNTKTIDIICSKYHYEILFNDNYSYDHNVILEFLKDIASTTNIINNSYKVVLMRNVQFLNQKMYDNIKTICEKYSENVKFMMISPSLLNVPRYMFGFFYFIRVPRLSLIDAVNFFKEYKIIKDQKKLENLLIKYRMNLNTVFAMLDLIKQNPNYNLVDPIENRYKKLLTLINKKEPQYIEKLRKELYELTSCNINKTDLVMYMFENFIDKQETSEQKINLIEKTNNIIKKITNSYRDLFHIEYYLVWLMTT
jgi:DNA polymerase III delta prime subunit